MSSRRPEDQPLLAVAPMLAVTNTHFRNFVRCFTRRTTLYTEMVVDSTLLHNRESLHDHIGFDDNEHPIVCQLGGSDPQSVAVAAKYAEEMGYDELNLNVGCPSNRVATKGCFGAALMKHPEQVRDIISAIRREVNIPVSVKTRIGYDHNDSSEFTRRFVEVVSGGGCDHFVVHARKAWLKGLDPKKNRSVPPLIYERVFELADAFPHLRFTLNGGVTTLEQANSLLRGDMAQEFAYKSRANVNSESIATVLHGVMIGRAIVNDPCLLASADSKIYDDDDNLEATRTRATVLHEYMNYLDRYENTERRVSSVFTLVKPILGILNGMPGQRCFRRVLDSTMRSSGGRIRASEVVATAMEAVQDAFPGILGYPIDMGKCAQYRELVSDSVVRCNVAPAS